MTANKSNPFGRNGIALNLVAALALVSAVLEMPGAHAQTPFYQGKRLTILNNFAAGGPSDVEVRILAKHLSKHLDGHPGIIVQNKDGAGGLVGTNYLGEVAPRDGTMMGYFTGAAWKYIIQPEAHRVDFRTYEFIGYQSGNAVYYVRSDTKPGLKQAVDLMKAQELVAGGLVPESSKDLLIRLTLDMLGVTYKYVSGYRSTANARIALERGEINFYSETVPGFISVIAPNMAKSGEVIPLYYDPDCDGTSFSKLVAMADYPAPPFPDFYKAIKGEMPSGQLWNLYRTNLAVDSAMLRTIVLPPGSPRAAVEALRVSIDRLNGDKDFAEDAFKAMQFIPRYATGHDINEHARRALSVDPELRSFAISYIKGVK